MFDLLIEGGTAIDPASGLHAKRDVAVTGGRIVAIEEKLNRDNAKKVIDAGGAYVSPGFIDLHAHVYWGVSWFGIDADPWCTASGITTIVDAGSSGPINFPGFKRYVIEQARTRILAFVHIAHYGIQPRPAGELLNLGYASPNAAARIVKEMPDIAVGVKIRMGDTMVGGPDNARTALKMAVKAARDCGKPLMVHIGDTPISLDEIIDVMDSGDIITHCYHGMKENIFDKPKILRPSVMRGRERGIVFDLGHASLYAFTFDVAREAMALSFRADTLSSDASIARKPGAREPGREMPHLLSKFLALGWTLDEVIAAATVKPAKVLGWQDRIGQLAVGREADITVFEVREGPVTLRDAVFAEIQGDREMFAMWTIRAGEPRPARGNSAYVEPLKHWLPAFPSWPD